MGVYFIPTSTGGTEASVHKSRDVVLEGKSYTLTFRWCSFDESWTMAVGLVGEDPLYRVKVTTNTKLNSQYRYLKDAPKGMFIVEDMTGTHGRVDRKDFHIEGRFRLLYIDNGG